MNNIDLVEQYYFSIIEKNFLLTAIFLAGNVCLISPLADLRGKDAVIEAAQKMSVTPKLRSYLLIPWSRTITRQASEL